MNANKRRRQGPVETLTIPEMIPKGQFNSDVKQLSSPKDEKEMEEPSIHQR
jgi:hypothetical protein